MKFSWEDYEDKFIIIDGNGEGRHVANYYECELINEVERLRAELSMLEVILKSKVYTVRACRWGDTETHSYIVGVYPKKAAAQKAAEIEEEYRSGKYECEIQEWILGEGKEGRHFEPKTIKELKGR